MQTAMNETVPGFATAPLAAKMTENDKFIEISCVRTPVGAHGIRTTIQAIHNGNQLAEIYWEFQGPHLPELDGVNDFAVVALLAFAMNRSLGIHVRGTVSRSLLEAVEECQDVWSRWRPDLFKRVSLRADVELDAAGLEGRGAVMAFSGGVDACFSLFAHKRKLLSRRAKDIRSAVLILGFDIPLERNDWADLAIVHAKNILGDFDVPLTIVRTNWKDFCVNWEMAFGFGVASVLHQFAGKFSTGVWSADEPYGGEVLPWGNHSTSNTLLFGQYFPIVATGGGWTRSEKVALIGASDSIRSNLRVCWAFPENKLNCGQCEKCVRTYLNFLATGHPVVPALGPKLEAGKVRRIKIKHWVSYGFYEEIRSNYQASLPHDIYRALNHALRMGPYYIRLKKFLDTHPALKQLFRKVVNPRWHY
jgi:hypothetical protein